MNKSKIEWTEATWNPVTGCSKVSEGCRNCYAEKVSHRFGWTEKPWTALNAAENVVLHPDRLEQPLHWRRPRRVFVNSMSDLFHPEVPDDYIDQVFAVMALSPQHTFQILTKRPVRMAEYFREFNRKEKIAAWIGTGGVYPAQVGNERRVREMAWPLPNVWLGVSCENQRAADERIPLLLQTPAAVRFLSCEPLLGPVNLLRSCERSADILTHRYLTLDEWGIDWVIVGGESGPNARPMHPDWARELRDQCQAAGVAYFHKQNGEWTEDFTDNQPGPVTIIDRNGKSWKRMEALAPEGSVRMKRVGKKKSGRLLDGREWNEYPGEGEAE